MACAKKQQKPQPPRSSVVEKRRKNDSGKGRHGLKNPVTDNDPMQKDSESNYP